MLFRSQLELLGAELAYTGRSLPSAHLPLKIFSGHFDRRLKLLELTFAALDVPLEVSELWLTHDRRMRGAITRDENCEGQGRKLPLL